MDYLEFFHTRDRATSPDFLCIQSFISISMNSQILTLYMAYGPIFHCSSWSSIVDQELFVP